MWCWLVLLAPAFVHQLVRVCLGRNSEPIVWHVIDTVLPVMFAVEAHRLWRATSVWRVRFDGSRPHRRVLTKTGVDWPNTSRPGALLVANRAHGHFSVPSWFSTSEEALCARCG